MDLYVIQLCTHNTVVGLCSTRLSRGFIISALDRISQASSSANSHTLRQLQQQLSILS